MTILHIDSSARTQGSVTRDLSAQIVAKLGGDVNPPRSVRGAAANQRDLGERQLHPRSRP